MAPVTQIVIFNPAEDTTPDQVQKIYNGGMALKDLCVHPKTGNPYIKTATGGKGTTTDILSGQESGQQIFIIVEFASAEDRKYFLTEDPAHAAFAKESQPYVASIQTSCFAPGAF